MYRWWVDRVLGVYAGLEDFSIYPHRRFKNLSAEVKLPTTSLECANEATTLYQRFYMSQFLTLALGIGRYLSI